MACKLCQLLCAWLCRDAGEGGDRFWQKVHRWEQDHSNDHELWLADSDVDRERNETACAIADTQPEHAFRLFLESAAAGSVWAMETVGCYYWIGTGATPDFGKARDYYHRAIRGGSWMATIGYARLLAAHGEHVQSEEVLEDGVRRDFAPAFFWQAWLRFKRSPTRRTAREIRPLLEHACGQGHPGAELILARLMIFGKLGFDAVPEGLRRIRKIVALVTSGGEAGPASAEETVSEPRGAVAQVSAK